MGKKTVVLGASTNPQRVSYDAIHRLTHAGHEVVPIGIKTGEVAGIAIIQGEPELEEVDTLTLYLNPTRQKPYYDYILGMKPNRIIFNPGTENPELAKLARENDIEVSVACTLVMLATGQY